MKTILVSIVSLVLGVSLGWRRGHDPESPGATGAGAAAERGPAVHAGDHGRTEEFFGLGWRGWADRIQSAETQETLESLFRELMQDGDTGLREPVGGLMGARWVEVDPVGGVRFLGEEEHGRWVLHPMLADWAMRDMAAALAGIAVLDAPAGNRAKDEVLKRLIRRDPDASLAFMRMTRRYVHYHKESEWQRLARARPDAFAALVVEIETENLERGQRYQAHGLVGMAARELALRDPQEALDWADGLYRGIRRDAVRTVLGVWAEQDPKAVVAQVAEWKRTGTGPQPLSGMTLMLDGRIARELGRVDPAAGAEWVKDHWMEINQFAEVLSMRMAREELSCEEVFAAISPVESFDDTVRTRLFSQLWNRMSREELVESFDMLQAQAADGPRITALAGVAREMLARNPGEAVQLVRRVPPGTDRAAVIRKLFAGSSYSAREIEKAVSALPAQDRSVAISALFGKDPPPPGGDGGKLHARVYAAAMDPVPPSAHRTKALERLALHWGGRDPAAAMHWAAGLPAAEGVVATGAVARGWAPQDVFSLADHVTGMPPGRSRDTATVALVEAGRAEEPDLAWEWAERIDDAAARADARRHVMEAWAQRDPDGAREAIDAADLGDTEREALRAMLVR